jgi:hypothetical protein
MNKLHKQTALEAFGKSFVWQGSEDERTFEDFCNCNDLFTIDEFNARYKELMNNLVIK